MTSNCRECETLVECIQESERAPGVKEMVLRTFETGRDTQELWDELHKECLKIRWAQQGRKTLLSQRLKAQTKDADEESEKATLSPPPATPIVAQKSVRKSVRARLKKAKQKAEEKKTVTSCHCLLPQNGHPRVALPAHGEITLGRFDLKGNAAPDVDLSRYDQDDHLVSRKHARIVGRHNRHYIEDLYSANGTKINEDKLVSGQKLPLQSGDRIILGGVEFTYTPVSKMQITPPTAPSHAYLWVAFTGNRFSLPSWGEVIVGRSDHTKGIIPDIDLSEEGEAAQVVTRRHVKIIARDGQHYVEDLGSTNSTKLNGARIESKEFGPLTPGDHIWLGGCVLVYRTEVEHSREPQPAGES